MSVQTTRASADRDVHDIVADALESVEIGPIMSHRNISIAPLSLPRKPQTMYTGWQEAYFSGSIGVREVDATGAVEELFVTNQAGGLKVDLILQIKTTAGILRPDCATGGYQCRNSS